MWQITNSPFTQVCKFISKDIKTFVNAYKQLCNRCIPKIFQIYLFLFICLSICLFFRRIAFAQNALLSNKFQRTTDGFLCQHIVGENFSVTIIIVSSQCYLVMYKLLKQTIKIVIFVSIYKSSYIQKVPELYFNYLR